MRRAFGVVLAGVAALALLLAVLLPTFVVPRSKKTPLDLNITLRSNGTAKVLNAATGATDDHKLRATRIVRTDSAKSDATNTVVNESLCIVIADDPTTPDCVPSSDPTGRLLSYTTDRVATDRKTGEAVNDPKYLENVNGDPTVKHDGMAYKWPIDAKKQTYKFFQPDLGKAFDATFIGTEKKFGLTLYKYECKTGEQDYLVNGTFPGTYDDTRTVWVEPRTGAIVIGAERQVQKIKSSDPAEPATVALEANLIFDDASQTFQADYAKDKIDDLDLAGVWAPIGLGVLGVIAAVGSFFLLRERREPGAPESSEPTPAGAGVGPGDAR